MVAQVGRRALDDIGIVAQVSDAGVAGRAEQPTHRAGGVIVVDADPPGELVVADRTPATLCNDERVPGQ